MTRPLLTCLLLLLLGAVADVQAEPNVTLYKDKLPPPPAHILMKPQVAGREFTMAFDTGAGITAVAAERQELLGHRLSQQNVTDAAGNLVSSQMFQGEPMTLQKLTLADIRVSADLAFISGSIGQRIDGLIGMLDLKGNKLWLDYETGTLEIHQGPWRLQGKEVREAGLLENGGSPVLSVDIGGHTRSLLLDTGSDGCITLATPLFEALVSEGFIALRSDTTSDTTLGSERDLKRGRFLKGELMGRSLAGVSVVAGKTPESGILGLAWLCGFSMEISLADDSLRYVVAQNARPPINIEAMMGVFLAYADGKPVVRKLKPDGPAVAAGLADGDIIEKLGGLAGDQFDRLRLMQFCEENASRAVPVTITRKADGRKVEITLRLNPRQDFWHVPAE